MTKIIIDAENEVMGRVASYAAKQALLGNEITIVNCEKAIISGSKKTVIGNLKELRALNKMKPRKGPFFSKNSEKIFLRSIRGMLPDPRLGRGKIALSRVKCYIGIPENIKKEKMMKMNTNLTPKKVTLQELSRLV